MGIKVVVIGGGSTYTPELIEGLTNRRDRLPIDELVLHDLDMNRLQVVGGLAQRMLHRVEWPGRLTLTDDAPGAVDDADFVLIQLRVGGQQARLSDETLPLEFDTIGQETTGAGGFAKALRTVPVVMELAELVRQRAAPDAWIVDFTNPVGIVTQALLDEGHRALGLCNVAIGFQRRFAQDLGVEPERVTLDHVGLNHLSWITAVTVDGTDRLPEILQAEAPQHRVHGPAAGRADSRARRSAVLLPALLLRLRRGPGRATRRPQAGRRGDRPGAAAAGDVSPIRRSTPSPTC